MILSLSNCSSCNMISIRSPTWLLALQWTNIQLMAKWLMSTVVRLINQQLVTASTLAVALRNYFPTLASVCMTHLHRSILRCPTQPLVLFLLQDLPSWVGHAQCRIHRTIPAFPWHHSCFPNACWILLPGLISLNKTICPQTHSS